MDATIKSIAMDDYKKLNSKLEQYKLGKESKQKNDNFDEDEIDEAVDYDEIYFDLVSDICTSLKTICSEKKSSEHCAKKSLEDNISSCRDARHTVQDEIDRLSSVKNDINEFIDIVEKHRENLCKAQEKYK